MELDRFVLDAVDGAMCDLICGSTAGEAPPQLLLRSAAVEALLERQVDAIAARAARTVAAGSDNASHPASIGVAAVAAGLMLRMFPADPERLKAVDLVLPATLLVDVDSTLERVLRDQLDEDERDAWRGERFADVRAAFAEAGLRAWLSERRAVRRCEVRRR